MLTPMFNVVPTNSRIVRSACLLALLCGKLLSLSAIAESAAETVDETVEHSRQKFQLAVKELRSGAGPRYQLLRQELADYPLAMYLDALVIEGNLHYATADEMKTFMASAGDSPLAMRTLRSFVRHKVEDRRWQTIIEVTDRSDLSTELSCHRAHALLNRRRASSAIPLLNSAWSVGKSQIKACDPAFKTWFKHSGPTDDVVWERALKAADARNSYLLRYLQRFASRDLKRSLADLAEIYRRPDRVTQKVRGRAVHQRDIAYVGVKRLARVNPGKAYNALQELKTRFDFETGQLSEMQGLIVRHSLFAKSAAPAQWILEQLMALDDDELTEIHLRAKIETADWTGFREAYTWLSAEKQSTDEWRYWRAIAAGPGEAELAQTTFEQLAEGRGFHAYLAATTLAKPLSLGMMPDAAEETITASHAVVERVSELLALGMDWEARTEFRSGLDEPDIALSLAELAASSERHSWAIEAAAAAGAWGRVDLRFPLVFEDEFESAAKESGLSVEALLAVARRESALSPDAVSEVGARGLMQLMPSTARLTARKHNYRYSRSRLMRPGYNTAVGGLYYADLIDNYGGNRVLALAAYNAGPNRVRRWREGGLSVARWVDTIPFKETREYVRAVLAYNVIYSLKAGTAVEFLSESELAPNY
ncbi:soluble lytic murein transglycosylase-like protein [gamma proteobacterium HIMB55]|nr:soluble lytic murein transglycosylase-like protein [gamma proteobacterium HIMB55]